MSEVRTGTAPSNQTENKMGTMPVGKLLFSMSLPMIISMLIQALYNIVDSMFVAQINEGALTAVSLVFPMQNIVISIATGTGVGVNALLSRYLGEKKFKEADDVAHHSIFLAIISGILVGIVMFLVAGPFLAVQTDDPMIYSYGVSYMNICCGICLGVFLQVGMERLLTSTGRTMLTMISQAAGAVINIILDPILIFGYFGFPEMGVAGAAAATVFAQFMAALIGLFLNRKYNKEITTTLRGFRPDWKLIGTIYKIGVPSIIMAGISSVMTFGMNLILMQYLKSSTATAVFGVYYKLNSFIFMPIFGLNNGMVPIIAYNYGARHRSRITRTAKLGVITATVLMMIGLALFWIIPDKLLLIYNASEEMLAIGIPALRIISISFIFAGYCIVIGSVMQALGKAVYSMINSLTRQMIILLPAAAILAVVGGLDAVWWSFDIAEICSLILTTIFFSRVYRTIIKPLPE